MLFTADITVETTHTASNPKEEIIKIAHGIITEISILFPSGCHGLVHAILLHHEHQIAPSTEGMSIIGDRYPIDWQEYYESYQPPYELKFKGWGVGCSYDHVVTVRIAILPRKAIVALSIVDAIRSAFGILSPRRIFSGGQGGE